jgi:RNA polymerase sigma-70 factor, ECF subfamily
MILRKQRSSPEAQSTPSHGLSHEMQHLRSAARPLALMPIPPTSPPRYAQTSAAATQPEPVPVTSAIGDAEMTLLAATAQGDAVAFRTLVEHHVRVVAAIGRRMLHDDAEAEDVAQEAFLRLWRNAATLVLGPGGVRPWLRRVVTNLCIDRIRAGRNTTVVAEVPEHAAPGSQERTLEERELSVRVDTALKQLPERQRAALVLFHYEGLSQIEIGATLGISDEAVESLLARARRALKLSLRDEWQALLPDAVD